MILMCVLIISTSVSGKSVRLSPWGVRRVNAFTLQHYSLNHSCVASNEKVERESLCNCSWSCYQGTLSRWSSLGSYDVMVIHKDDWLILIAKEKELQFVQRAWRGSGVWLLSGYGGGVLLQNGLTNKMLSLWQDLCHMGHSLPVSVTTFHLLVANLHNFTQNMVF